MNIAGAGLAVAGSFVFCLLRQPSTQTLAAWRPSPAVSVRVAGEGGSAVGAACRAGRYTSPPAAAREGLACHPDRRRQPLPVDEVFGDDCFVLFCVVFVFIFTCKHDKQNLTER